MTAATSDNTVHATAATMAPPVHPYLGNSTVFSLIADFLSVGDLVNMSKINPFFNVQIAGLNTHWRCTDCRDGLFTSSHECCDNCNRPPITCPECKLNMCGYCQCLCEVCEDKCDPFCPCQAEECGNCGCEFVGPGCVVPCQNKADCVFPETICTDCAAICDKCRHPVLCKVRNETNCCCESVRCEWCGLPSCGECTVRCSLCESEDFCPDCCQYCLDCESYHCNGCRLGLGMGAALGALFMNMLVSEND